jgi:hypothetical protein
MLAQSLAGAGPLPSMGGALPMTPMAPGTPGYQAQLSKDQGDVLDRVNADVMAGRDSTAAWQHALNLANQTATLQRGPARQALLRSIAAQLDLPYSPDTGKRGPPAPPTTSGGPRRFEAAAQ